MAFLIDNISLQACYCKSFSVHNFPLQLQKFLPESFAVYGITNYRDDAHTNWYKHNFKNHNTGSYVAISKWVGHVVH